MFFWFYDYNFQILRACSTPLERYFQDLSSGILKAPKFFKLQFVNQKTDRHSFSDYNSSWSKEPQWENDCGSYLPCFVLVLPLGQVMFPISSPLQLPKNNGLATIHNFPSLAEPLRLWFSPNSIITQP